MSEFLLNHLWEAWAIAALVFLVLELMAGDFFMMCLAVGAVVSALAAAVGIAFLPSIAVFAVVTLACLLLLRPKMLKRMARRGRKSNADALVGKTGTVKEEIKAGSYGYVAIDGDMWRSVSSDGVAIAAGTKVVVVSRESIVLTVKTE